jgi:streptogramin lyase
MRLSLVLIGAAMLAGCATTKAGSIAPAGAEGALFVAGKFGNTLSRIELATGRETARVETCANPHELAVSPDGRHVALACYGGAGIAIYRTDDLGQAGYVGLGEGARPHGIVWHEDGSIYATAEGRRSIYRIMNALNSVPVRFEFGTGKLGSHMLAVSPDGRQAWTTDLGSKTVTRVDLVTRRAPLSVEVGIEPEGIALAPDGKTLWVSARGPDKAFALDPVTLEVRREVAVGDFPLRIAVRPQGDVAITSDLGDAALSVIDTATGTKTRTIALDTRENAQTRQQVTVLWSPDGRRIYVAETGTDTIAEVDFASGTVLRRLEGGDGGDGLAIVTDNGS